MTETSVRIRTLCMMSGIFLVLGLLTGMIGANLRSAAAPYGPTVILLCAAVALMMTARAWTLRKRQRL